MTGFSRNAVPGEFILRWQSASNRWYTVQAATNLMTGFTLDLRTNIPATPPENVHRESVQGVGDEVLSGEARGTWQWLPIVEERAAGAEASPGKAQSAARK